MYIKPIIGLLFVIICLGVMSCAAPYAANSRNVPMFQEANEFKGNVSWLNGIEGQVAYSLSDHVAAMANGTVLVSNYDLSQASAPRRPHRLFGEGGIGYFKAEEGLRYEIFGGYGMGQSYGRQPKGFITDDFLVKARYERIFFQPSVAFDFERSMLIVTSRISAVNFRSYEPVIDSVSIDAPVNDFNLFFEPSLTWRFHLARKVNAYFQLGLSTPLTDIDYRFGIFQLSAGLQLHSRHSRKDGD